MGSSPEEEEQEQEQEEKRTFPLKRPRGHKVPVPRWSLQFPDTVTHIYTIYIGVQCHSKDTTLQNRAETLIENLLITKNPNKPPAIDTFRVTDGFDLENSRVWVAYYTSPSPYQATLSSLDLTATWRKFGSPENKHIGLWIENFVAPISRLETNYARLDHKPGLAQLPNTTQPGHDLTAYWGAGRDRIPASAHDKFETPPPEETRGPEEVPRGFGEKLKGRNWENMCHIRSGQFWQNCQREETESYELGLQGKLMKGMNYLWSNPAETGTIGLRFLQNLDENGEGMKETCGAGFHKNWADLEQWSSRHPSHLAIFNGMMAHAKTFGEERKLMTWHEVWIFKKGEAEFEYVNCDPRTGVVRWVEMEEREVL